MPLDVKCGNCNKAYQTPEAMAGKKLRCKACGGVVEVPVLETLPSYESAAEEVVPGGPATGAEFPEGPLSDGLPVYDDTYRPAMPKRPIKLPRQKKKTSERRIVPGSPDASHARQMAARSCRALALCQLLLGSLLGLLYPILLVTGARPKGLRPEEIITLVIAVAILAIGTTYLICGSLIKNGSVVAAVIVLILACIEEVGAVLSVGNLLSKWAASHDPPWIALAISGLAAAGFAQLIFHLVTALRE